MKKEDLGKCPICGSELVYYYNLNGETKIGCTRMLSCGYMKEE